MLVDPPAHDAGCLEAELESGVMHHHHPSLVPIASCFLLLYYFHSTFKSDRTCHDGRRNRPDQFNAVQLPEDGRKAKGKAGGLADLTNKEQTTHTLQIHNLYRDRLRQFTDGGQYRKQGLLG